MASVRNRGRSIADIARESMSPLAYRLLLVFMWLALVYVLTVFTDLTATTFVQDGGVATSSWLFVALAICFGLCVYRLKIPVLWASLVFVPLVFVATWVGQLIPIPSGWIESTLGLRSAEDLVHRADRLLLCGVGDAGLDPAPASRLPVLVPAVRLDAAGAGGHLVRRV